MDMPYFPVEEDDFSRSSDFIQSLKGTLKHAKVSQSEDSSNGDEVDDQWLDDIIQSVFTEGQKATFKVYLETFSKKNKMARGDVRSLFVPQVPNFPDFRRAERGVNCCDGNQLKVPNSNENDDNIMRKQKKIEMGNRKLDPNFWNEGGGQPTSPCLVHHLGLRDLLLLGGLARAEVLTVFMQNGVKTSKLQSKRKPKDVGVFGVPLQVLLNRDVKKYPNARVPLFLLELISMLECHVQEEGILRVPGSVSRIKDTIQALESDDNYLPILNSLMPHDLTGLLKQFLRDLPHPIFTLDWLDGFCRALAIADEGTKLHTFQSLFCLLPDVNRATLQLVFGLLHKISLNASSNKMTVDNVSMTIGPTLFLIDSAAAAAVNRNSSALSELDNLSKFVGVTNYLLRNIDKIWTVPLLLLKQLRQINTGRDAKKTKTVEKKANDQKKRSADRRVRTAVHPENTFENVYIHSCHPDFPSLCLEFSNTMTIADVLNRLNRFKEPNFLRASSLFECGGSVEHLVLSTSSNISEILDENPFARFCFCRQSPESLIAAWPQFY